MTYADVKKWFFIANQIPRLYNGIHIMIAAKAEPLIDEIDEGSATTKISDDLEEFTNIIKDVVIADLKVTDYVLKNNANSINTPDINQRTKQVLELSAGVINAPRYCHDQFRHYVNSFMNLMQDMEEFGKKHAINMDKKSKKRPATRRK